MKKIQSIKFTLLGFLYYFRIKYNKLKFAISCYLNRLHLIDLRIDNDVDYYPGGQLSADKKLVIASFKVLEDFIQKECNNEYLIKHYEMEKNFKNLNAFDRQWVLEMRDLFEIYRYWVFKREQLHKYTRKMFNLYQNARRGSDKDLRDKLFEDYRRAADTERIEESDNLHALIRLRGALWKS